jgi:hypothetical protein
MRLDESTCVDPTIKATIIVANIYLEDSILINTKKNKPKPIE